MEEEMRKIEEEFAFQEKWIKIFKRGKFFFQNIPELIILKIITKMKARVFFNLLRTGKWMHLLCRENRDSLIIPFNVPHFLFYSSKDDFASKETKQRVEELFRLMEKLIRSKYYFHLYDLTFGSDLLTEFYSKHSYYFNRRCWTIETLSCHVTSMNRELVQNLQPKIINLLDRNHNGPMSVHFSVPPITHLIVNSNAIIASDFYNEIEQFGPLNCMITLNRKGGLELKKLLSIMKEVTKKRHLNHPLLEFLTFSREKYNEYRIFESWPELYDLPINDLPTQLFYFIIVARSEIAVTASYLLRVVRGEQEYFTIEFERVASSQEWKAYVNNGKHFEYSFIQPYANKEFEKQKVAFTKQVSSRFFEGGRVIYPPLAPPEPAPEFVKFLKEFEDFDIQPEKLAPHKPKWKKTEKLPDLPRKLPEIHSKNRLIEAKEVIKLRKFWMDFLQKKKFILELLPKKNVLDVAKRIKVTQFASLFTSCKWIHDLIQESHFRIHGGSWNISRQMLNLDPALESLRRKLDKIELFYLRQISFNSFHADMVFLKELVTTIGEKKIFVKKIKLLFSPLIQEMISILKPNKVHLSYVEFLANDLQFPPTLKHISVSNIVGSEMREIMASLTGLPIQVKWKVNDFSICEAIVAYLQELKAKKSLNSNISIVIRSQISSYKKECGEILSTDQNASETVYVFSSMVKDQWMYYFRLEKCGEYGGAVGVAFYEDYQSIADQKATIKCEYFPKMEDVLSYFEREIGSKRNAGQCGKKEGLDNLIFDAQKEEEKHFEEIRRRFFD